MLDEPATGQGLLGFFLRGVSAGAITEAEALDAHGPVRRRDPRRIDRVDLRRRGLRPATARSAGERRALGAARLHRPLGARHRRHHVDRQLAAVQLARPQSPSRRHRERGRPALGTIWLLHSGGFYYVEKTLLDGEPLPRPLHWFKWQAYTTWLSGMALLLVVYYLSDRAILADPSVAALSHGAAVAVGVGCDRRRMVALRIDAAHGRAARAGGRAGDLDRRADRTRRSRSRSSCPVARRSCTSARCSARSWRATSCCTIVPSQRELVASVGGGVARDPAISARAKRVSIHNNYFTFPVIALMVSNHFPMLYGHRWSWLHVARASSSAGVRVRHVLNIRFTFAAGSRALAVTMIASTVALYGVVLLSRSAARAVSDRRRRAGDGDVRRRAPRDRPAMRRVSLGAVRSIRRSASRRPASCSTRRNRSWRARRGFRNVRSSRARCRRATRRASATWSGRSWLGGSRLAREHLNPVSHRLARAQADRHGPNQN